MSLLFCNKHKRTKIINTHSTFIKPHTKQTALTANQKVWITFTS